MNSLFLVPRFARCEKRALTHSRRGTYIPLPTTLLDTYLRARACIYTPVSYRHFVHNCPGNDAEVGAAAAASSRVDL